MSRTVLVKELILPHNEIDDGPWEYMKGSWRHVCKERFARGFFNNNRLTTNDSQEASCHI